MLGLILYQFYMEMIRVSVADPGGGGSRGSGPPPPLLGHDVGFLTLGPKFDPPPFCECPRVGVFFNNFSEGGWRHADNVQGGGVLVKNPVSAPGPPPPFQKSWIRAWVLITKPNIKLING